MKALDALAVAPVYWKLEYRMKLLSKQNYVP